MTIIYCAKSDRTDIADKIRKGKIEVEDSFRFKSPQDVSVDHSATSVVMANEYGNVRAAYAGICSIRVLDEQPEQDKPESSNEEE